MNYNDTIHENKIFNFTRALFQNAIYAIGIVIAFCAICMVLFGFRARMIRTDSQYPVFNHQDAIVYKAQKDYEIGDIINFDTDKNITHRLIGITTDGYYVCKGDNVQSCIQNYNDYRTWQEEAETVKGKTSTELNSDNYRNLQIIRKQQVNGKYLFKLVKVHSFYNAIIDNIVLVIALFIGMWGLIAVVESELEMKKGFRLIYR